MALKKPAFTMVPHEVIDTYMRDMTGSEIKVFLVILRATLGWHRDTKAITLAQMSELSGLSSGSCSDATASLEGKNLIVKYRQKTDEGGHAATVYEPAFEVPPYSANREGYSTGREAPIRQVENYKEEIKQELNIKTETPVSPLHENQNTEQAPVDFNEFLRRWKQHRGFKKPNRTMTQHLRESWWPRVEISSDDLDAALDGYYDSDWAKQNNYPPRGFLKDPHSWIPRPDQWLDRVVDTTVNHPHCAPREPGPAIEIIEVSPVPLLAPIAPTRDHPAEWNRLVPAAPVEWSPRRSPIEALRLCEMDDEFLARFDEVCELAQRIHVARGKDVGWLTFSWILKRTEQGSHNWWRLLTELKWMASPDQRGAKPDPLEAAREGLRKRKEERLAREAECDSTKTPSTGE